MPERFHFLEGKEIAFASDLFHEIMRRYSEGSGSEQLQRDVADYIFLQLDNGKSDFESIVGGFSQRIPDLPATPHGNDASP